MTVFLINQALRIGVKVFFFSRKKEGTKEKKMNEKKRMKQEMIREAEQIRAKKEERVYPIEKTLNSLECLPERSLYPIECLSRKA